MDFEYEVIFQFVHQIKPFLTSDGRIHSGKVHPISNEIYIWVELKIQPPFDGKWSSTVKANNPVLFDRNYREFTMEKQL